MRTESGARWRVARGCAMAFVCCSACAGVEPGGTSATTQSITYGQLDGTAHPNVGAIVYHYVPDGNWYFYASGTLVAPKVFLTAGHATKIFEDNPTLVDAVGVDFDADIWAQWDPSRFHLGHPFTHPDYRARAPAEMRMTNDYGVIVLDEPVDLPLAALPSMDQLDEMNAHNGMQGIKFTTVGYGYTERALGRGGPTYSGLGVRRFAVGTFAALDPLMLHISQNPAKGDGGSCNGDSGGPNYLGDTNVIAGITSMGDVACQASSIAPRTDLESALSFVESFM